MANAAREVFVRAAEHGDEHVVKFATATATGGIGAAGGRSAGLRTDRPGSTAEAAPP
ncbi:hypothetical protein [Streptomyces sp. NBC_01314]|uniref:hypothetical protein n=1 Tax=Streptomyces sp. NBC_01314 TaxID=2903821 RepID=UPI00308F3DC3|nr:hypothetical protein OG622_34165 [Streptomyces sp. NBC_01314]